MKNKKQEEILNSLLEKIRENAGQILDQDSNLEVLYTNLINRGVQVYMHKDLKTQTTVDLCALCLAVFVTLEHKKGII